VIVSVSTKAVTGMRIENTERGVRHFHDKYLEGVDSRGEAEDTREDVNFAGDVG
jgi:hypothetical protein